MTENHDKRSAKDSRTVLLVDLGILAIFIVSIFGAAFSYTSYTTYVQSLSQGEANDAKIPTWINAYNFTTKDVFSALNPMTVDVIVHVYPTYFKSYPNETYADLPSMVYIYFPYAIPITVSNSLTGPVTVTEAQYSPYGEILGAPMELVKRADNTWRNSTKIMYAQEGQTCAFLSTKALTEIGCYGAAPLLTISSVAALYQAQANKVTLSLTWLVFAFTVILCRDFFPAAIENLQRVWRDHHETTQQVSQA
jgi:hypothetical protein